MTDIIIYIYNYIEKFVCEANKANVYLVIGSNQDMNNFKVEYFNTNVTKLHTYAKHV